MIESDDVGARRGAVTALARRHTEAAIAALVEVMQDPEAAPMARNAAANALLQWAHGRPGGKDETNNSHSKSDERIIIIRWEPEQNTK